MGLDIRFATTKPREGDLTSPEVGTGFPGGGAHLEPPLPEGEAHPRNRYIVGWTTDRTPRALRLDQPARDSRHRSRRFSSPASSDASRLVRQPGAQSPPARSIINASGTSPVPRPIAGHARPLLPGPSSWDGAPGARAPYCASVASGQSGDFEAPPRAPHPAHLRVTAARNIGEAVTPATIRLVMS